VAASRHSAPADRGSRGASSGPASDQLLSRSPAVPGNCASRPARRPPPLPAPGGPIDGASRRPPRDDRSRPFADESVSQVGVSRGVRRRGAGASIGNTSCRADAATPSARRCWQRSHRPRGARPAGQARTEPRPRSVPVGRRRRRRPRLRKAAPGAGRRGVVCGGAGPTVPSRRDTRSRMDDRSPCAEYKADFQIADFQNGARDERKRGGVPPVVVGCAKGEAACSRPQRPEAGCGHRLTFYERLPRPAIVSWRAISVYSPSG
jgi:hypothetical protein